MNNQPTDISNAYDAPKCMQHQHFCKELLTSYYSLSSSYFLLPDKDTHGIILPQQVSTIKPIAGIGNYDYERLSKVNGFLLRQQ